MSSVVEICSLALSHVGGYYLESLDEPRKEARECKRLYAPARDATLEVFDWGFARKRLALGLLADTVDGWDYVYAWPSDCAMPRRIYDPSNPENTQETDPIPMDLGVNSALSKRTIMTDQEDAILIYTAKVEDSNVYTASFVDALSWRLASDLAIPLRSDSKLQQNFLQQFRLRIGEAGVSSANADKKKPSSVSSFQSAR